MNKPPLGGLFILEQVSRQGKEPELSLWGEGSLYLHSKSSRTLLTI
jgi:hypothetical protein